MLVIISDLHLTDGSSGETIREGAFRILRERLSDLAYDASWRSEDSYEPIKSFDIVLLGDILDLIRSGKWLDKPRTGKGVRPWDDPRTQAYQNKIKAISDAILKNNAGSLDELKKMSLGKLITIPSATADGKPAVRDVKRLTVDVRIHYLIGNHDWFYHLDAQQYGTAYNNIRKKVVSAMGLANSANQPFPHDPFESKDIQDVFRKHQVFARHGDIYDPFNYEGDRNLSSLGDAIVIELVNRFPRVVRQEMEKELPEVCMRGLREIDNVRPLLMIPVWVDGLLRRTCPDPDQQKKVKNIWNNLADQFLDLKFVKNHNKIFSLFDSYDKLRIALKFSGGVSLDFASRLATRLARRAHGTEDRFYKNAFLEQSFKNRSARYIVYGHTHQYEVVPLDSAPIGDQILNQMYFNSGTWRRRHQLAKYNPKEQEFLDFNVMTYIAFFNAEENERKGRPFESWNGVLGV